MPLRHLCIVTALTLACGGAGVAQTRVRTETIKPPAPGSAPVAAPEPKASAKPSARTASPDTLSAAPPEIIADPARLPPPVARTRERILAAARSGDLQKLVTVMQMNETMPIFSLSEDKDPVAFWKANYPDSEGIEILSILTTIMETPFVHVDEGTPQDMYLWPYFTRMQLKALTPEQKVELFRIVTGSDYKDMLEFGAYSFYRVGIAPDGTWHFFVAGD